MSSEGNHLMRRVVATLVLLIVYFPAMAGAQPVLPGKSPVAPTALDESKKNEARQRFERGLIDHVR